MKWFQHQSNAHRDLDTEPLIEELGLEGYGFLWITYELVADKGKNYRIKERKDWKNYLKRTSKLPQEKFEKFLSTLVKLDLINEKAYNKGDLYAPKMKKYSDDYTKRIRRESEPSS